MIGTYFWEWDPNGNTTNVGPSIDSFSEQNSPALVQAIAGFQSVSVPAATQLVVTHAIGAQGSATLELVAADSRSVNFAGPTETLILDHSSTFTGVLFDFTGNGNPPSSDQIDLRDMNFEPGTTESFSGNASGGTLTVYDAQGNTANILLSGNYTNSTFTLSSDGQGGTVVIDPRVVKDQFVFKAPSSTSPVMPKQSSGSSGAMAESTSDSFVLHPATGFDDQQQSLLRLAVSSHDTHFKTRDNTFANLHPAGLNDHHIIV